MEGRYLVQSFDATQEYIKKNDRQKYEIWILKISSYLQLNRNWTCIATKSLRTNVTQGFIVNNLAKIEF